MTIIPIMQVSSGSLNLYVGPMFSGKTSKLIELYKQFTFCKIPTVVINYTEDIRYTDEPMMFTHDRTKVECVMGTKLNDIFPPGGERASHYKVFLINEGQFFPDIVEWTKAMVGTPYSKKVYICGLDGDFKRNTFSNWLDLIAYSDGIQKLSSFCCDCRLMPAIFSHRLTEDKEQKMIGNDAYIPLCRDCYEKRN